MVDVTQLQAPHADTSKKVHRVVSDSLGAGWIESMQIILEHGTWSSDDGMGSTYQKQFAGDVKLLEVPNLYLTLTDAEDDEILQRYALRDRIDLMIRKYRSVELLPDYKDTSYGEVFYDCDGVDQVDWVKRRLKEKPQSKSASITFHRPGRDVLTCISMLDFKRRDDRLDVNVVYRSQNVYSSMPGNVLAIREIHEDVAGAIGVPLGNFNLVVFSAHVYEPHISAAREVLQEVVGDGDSKLLIGAHSS